MLPTEVQVGLLFRYSYLWHWRHLEGREEGDKDRPCLVLAILKVEEDGSSFACCRSPIQRLSIPATP